MRIPRIFAATTDKPPAAYADADVNYGSFTLIDIPGAGLPQDTVERLEIFLPDTGKLQIAVAESEVAQVQFRDFITTMGSFAHRLTTLTFAHSTKLSSKSMTALSLLVAHRSRLEMIGVPTLRRHETGTKRKPEEKGLYANVRITCSFIPNGSRKNVNIQPLSCVRACKAITNNGKNADGLAIDCMPLQEEDTYRYVRPLFNDIGKVLKWPRFKNVRRVRLFAADLSDYSANTTKRQRCTYIDFNCLNWLELIVCEGESGFLDWLTQRCDLQLRVYIYVMAPKAIAPADDNHAYYDENIAYLGEFLASLECLMKLGLEFPNHFDEECVMDLLEAIHHGQWFEDLGETLETFYLGLSRREIYPNDWVYGCQSVKKQCPKTNADLMGENSTWYSLFEGESLPGLNDEWASEITTGIEYRPKALE